jgi:hypothetical protein
MANQKAAALGAIQLCTLASSANTVKEQQQVRRSRTACGQSIKRGCLYKVRCKLRKGAPDILHMQVQPSDSACLDPLGAYQTDLLERPTGLHMPCVHQNMNHCLGHVLVSVA